MDLTRTRRVGTFGVVLVVSVAVAVSQAAAKSPPHPPPRFNPLTARCTIIGSNQADVLQDTKNRDVIGDDGRDGGSFDQADVRRSLEYQR